MMRMMMMANFSRTSNGFCRILLSNGQTMDTVEEEEEEEEEEEAH